MKVTEKPTRPLVRYHGGKWKIAQWIIANFPPHRVYVEPFGGGASVLLRKPRSYAEVYNDLDMEMVNLFRVVRDQGDQLLHLIELTPFSRTDYLEAWYPAEDPVEQARRTLVRSFMGFGSAAITLMRAPKTTSRGGLARTGFRSNSNRSGTTPAGDWRNFPGPLSVIIDRLRGVVIENREALSVMGQHDGEATLHYVDPPYLASTRDKGCDYRHEMTDDQHQDLARFLHTLKGAVIVSGYDCALYREAFADWDRREFKTHADGARDRTEVLWLRNCDFGLFK